MGYLIKESGGDLVKIETLIDVADMQQLFSRPYPLTSTIKAGFTFVIVSAFIQVNGTLSYTSFLHLWIKQPFSTVKATFGRTLGSNLTPGIVSSFIVNINHGTTLINEFGVVTTPTRDFELSMNSDDATGDGNGFLTIYGYYLPDFI
jgi:hypothetical protein